ASRELLLTEGTRTVTVTVTTSNEVPIVSKDAIEVFLSGEGEWVAANNISSKLRSPLKGFEIELSLDAGFSPILPFDPQEFEEELGTDLPVIKVFLNPNKLRSPSAFQDFLDLKMESVTIDVKVKSLTQIVAFSDEGLQDTGKPFLPFSSIPKKGSSFYIGHSEVFQKNLKKLEIIITWENRPYDLKEHYAGYDMAENNDQVNFAIEATLLGKTGSAPIPFCISDRDEEDRQHLLKADKDVLVFNMEINPLLSKEEAEIYGENNKAGFLQLDLLNDLGHSQYQQVLTKQMLALARFPTRIIGAWYKNKAGELVKATSTTSISPEDEVILPNPPYTPSIKSIMINYDSKLEVNRNGESKGIQFIHLHPFKNTYEHLNEIKNSPLLPQFKSPKSKTEKDVLIPDAGALLIGIRDLQPKQSLSLLFQLVESTANAEMSKPKVNWHYLKSNQWEPFGDAELVVDTTDELLKAGIVELAIPHDINKENTILPSDLHWIKASVSENPEA